MKKFAIMLALLTAVMLAVSCGGADTNGADEPAPRADIDAGEPDDNNGGEADEPGALRDSLPDGLDFGGTVINLLVQQDSWKVREFVAEQITGELISDAVHRRNAAAEDRVNVRLNVIEGPGWEGWSIMASQIRASIMAGDQTYDMIAGWSARAPALAIDGLFLDLTELPHIDLDKPWWNQSIREMTVGGRLYFLAGDMTMSMIESCSVIFFNTRIHRDLALPDLYEAVLEGRWTLDFMNSLVRNIYEDLNGNGAVDDGDLFGAAFYTLNVTDGFMQSSAIRMITHDADGMPALDVEHERLGALVDKIYNLYFHNPGVRVMGSVGAITTSFRNDRLLIAPARLLDAIDLRDMETDFGIIPYPKFDEAQESYLTRVWDALSLMCVPMNAEKTQEIGAFMEAMAIESYRTLTPAYFDTALKDMHARDEASLVMLDMVRDGAHINFASIFNESIGSPWHVLRSLMGAQNSNFASWYEANSDRISAALERVVELMRE